MGSNNTSPSPPRTGSGLRLRRGTVRPGYYSEKTRDRAFGEMLDHMPQQEMKVYNYLIENGDSIAQEIADGKDIRLTSVHRALCSLVNAKLVIDSDQTKENPVSGKSNTLWHAVPVDLKLF